MQGEINLLKRDLAEESELWYSGLDRDVKEAYGDEPIQAVLLGHLLRLFDYPETDTLVKELTEKFKLAGTLADGVGWPPKPDKGTPLTLDEFRARNDDHIRERLFSRKASPQPQVMLADLLVDRRLGRVRGPFRPPAKWGAPPF